MTITTRNAGGPAAINNGAPGPGAPKLNLDHLRVSNPKIDELIKENPGLGKLLEKNTVSKGAREGEARTEVSWSFWTHSEGTNKKYGHGMSDKQITSDYIVVFQPSTEKGAAPFCLDSFSPFAPSTSGVCKCRGCGKPKARCSKICRAVLSAKSSPRTICVMPSAASSTTTAS